MTYTVGGSYYWFELRQQAACMATCSFLIAHRLFSDNSRYVTDMAGTFLSCPKHPDQPWAPPASSGISEGSKAVEAWSWALTTVKLPNHESVEPSYTSPHIHAAASAAAMVQFWLCLVPAVHLTLQQPQHSWRCNMFRIVTLWTCPIQGPNIPCTEQNVPFPLLKTSRYSLWKHSPPPENRMGE
jgi:hypothetical protein